MRNIISLASILTAGLAVSACSSSKDEFADIPQQTLYEQGQNYLQEGNYNAAIRHLEAVDTYKGAYGEQVMLSLIYAQYKVGEYYKALDVAERFVRAFPDSSSMDYVYYLAGLSNARLSDNFIQDFLKVNRSSRAVENVFNAYGSFQTIVQYFPHSRYAAEAEQWMRYLKNRLAEHELSIAQFYMEREAYVAAANRLEELLNNHPDSKASFDGLPYLQTAFEKMGIQDSAAKVAELIRLNENREFNDTEKPAYSEQF